MDEPNARSLHKVAIPRTGGLAILIALAVAGFLGYAFNTLTVSTHWTWLLLALLPVAIISLIDDRGGVKPGYRLVTHLLSATLLVMGGMSWSRLEFPDLLIELGAIFSTLLTILLVVWVINLFNFMDGMDGLAGGMAFFGFGSLAILGWQGGDTIYFLVCLCISAASAGFLTANLPPARIFLGDLGSTCLGLSCAALSLLGSNEGLFPLWVAGLAFSPFLFDATVTLLRRALMGKRLWEAHRSHYYQRLVLAGWSQRRVMRGAWLLMAACGISAIAAPTLASREQWMLIAFWACIYIIIAYRVQLEESRTTQGQP